MKQFWRYRRICQLNCGIRIIGHRLCVLKWFVFLRGALLLVLCTESLAGHEHVFDD